MQGNKGLSPSEERNSNNLNYQNSYNEENSEDDTPIIQAEQIPLTIETTGY